MRTTIKFAALAIVATAGTAFANTGSVSQDLNTGLLSPTCGFSNPVTGSLTYNEGFNRFASAADPSTIDVSLRNISSITVTPDGTISSGDIVSSAYWGGSGDSMSSVETYPVVGTTGLAAAATLSGTDEFSSTMTLDPHSITMDAGFLPAQNATYSINYTVVCVQ